jgi:hypothetical protein
MDPRTGLDAAENMNTLISADAQPRSLGRTVLPELYSYNPEDYNVELYSSENFK